MTNPRTKKAQEAGELSETCKAHVREWVISTTYKRRKIFSTRATLKGTQEETASLMTLEDYRGEKGLFKCKDRFEDDWMLGHPDCLNGDEVIEIKTPYDLFSFHKQDGVKTATGYSGYGWQLQGYMALTGMKFGTLAYVLTNSPEYIIESEIKKAWYAHHIDTPEEQDWFDKEVEPRIRANHIYSGLKNFPDIPVTERVIEYDTEYDEEAVNRIRERVDLINYYLENNPKMIWK